MHRLLRGLAVVGAIVAGAAAAAQDTLRFGVDPTFAPFEYKNPDGTLTGFNVEVGEAIAPSSTASATGWSRIGTASSRA